MATQETGSKKAGGTQVGKRYKCVTCGSEVLVTKPGSGTLRCCGQEMQQK
ncbi:MAG: desulforedoxin [Chloroflexota bacterium]|nr:MAG: desulforedoxin [Chloroflexota bacterium]